MTVRMSVTVSPRRTRPPTEKVSRWMLPEALAAHAPARGMQVRDDNPLVGLDGRADLLRRLGGLVASKPDIFASNDTPRSPSMG